MSKLAIPSSWCNQSAGDNLFTRKCRLLQSYHRAETLRAPCGFGPNHNSPEKYGNIIGDQANTGLNFLDTGIFDYVKNRINNRIPGETFDEYRLFNNMLSSQPLCFSLFYPLKRFYETNPKETSAILNKCFPAINLINVLSIEIEKYPTPNEQYLGDGTAFDAMIIYEYSENSEGAIKKGILAIETKYSEKLGTNPSQNLTRQIAIAIESGLFTENGIEAVKNGVGQLGRNFLLALKYKKAHNLDYASAVVIAPRENSSENEIVRFRENLIPNAHSLIFSYNMEDFVDVLVNECPGEMQSWALQFFNRYLDFSPIQPYI